MQTRACGIFAANADPQISGAVSQDGSKKRVIAGSQRIGITASAAAAAPCLLFNAAIGSDSNICIPLRGEALAKVGINRPLDVLLDFQVRLPGSLQSGWRMPNSIHQRHFRLFVSTP
jgi:hypothetical protein